MKLLILGGTVFVGRHLAEAALARGYEVTLFNRGQHNADLFPEVEKLRGDRDTDLSALAGRRWDAVIDTCGYVPRAVAKSAEFLADAVGHYTFISSISVYKEFKTPQQDETAPVGVLDDPNVEEVTGETYGPLKALCEQVAERALPGRTLNIRPGFIVGPHDPTDRFTYWVRRIARGGKVLAPGDPQAFVQFIDARDLAEWTLDVIERGTVGAFNATGPASPLTFGDWFEETRRVSGSDAQFTWADGAFLEEAKAPMPLWIPNSSEEHAHIHNAGIEKAVAAGLTFRPLAQTLQDTLEWDAARPADTPLRAGPTPEREVELLQAWHGQHGK